MKEPTYEMARGVFLKYKEQPPIRIAIINSFETRDPKAFEYQGITKYIDGDSYRIIFFIQTNSDYQSHYQTWKFEDKQERDKVYKRLINEL